MTNEQLTAEIIDLKSSQAKAEIEFGKLEEYIKELQEDVKTTKNLAEDVHIMAKTMESMQITIADTNKKVDELSNREFKNYQENKKAFKQQIRSAVYGALITVILGAVGLLFQLFFSQGGKV